MYDISGSFASILHYQAHTTFSIKEMEAPDEVSLYQQRHTHRDREGRIARMTQWPATTCMVCGGQLDCRLPCATLVPGCFFQGALDVGR